MFIVSAVEGPSIATKKPYINSRGGFKHHRPKLYECEWCLSRMLGKHTVYHYMFAQETLIIPSTISAYALYVRAGAASRAIQTNRIL